MNNRLDVRLKPEEWELLSSRMLEWNLTEFSETLHRILSEYQQLEIDKQKLEKDIDVMRNLLSERPVQSKDDKKRADYKTMNCLRGLNLPISQADYFCYMCHKNHPREYEACQKLKV